MYSNKAILIINTKLNFNLTLVAKAACVISLSLTMENSW